LIEKPDGKRLLRRPKRREKHNIKMNLRTEEVRLWIKFIWLSTGTSGGHVNSESTDYGNVLNS
jgi:hypothetical protein